jgi:hypothetical protein
MQTASVGEEIAEMGFVLFACRGLLRGFGASGRFYKHLASHQQGLVMHILNIVGGG